jgi:hypothetical protein
MVAKKKSASRKPAAKKAAAKRRPAKRKVAKRKAARPTAVPAAVAELDERIARARTNLRELTELAAASSGASTEELTAQRISEQETKLRLLIDQRDQLVARGKKS